MKAWVDKKLKKNPHWNEASEKQDIPDLIAGALGVSRGTAYDLMREALAEQPAQQEPVAYMNPDNLEKMKRFGRGSVAWPTPTDFCTQPVYTSPPANKPWVGLTLGDMYEIGEFKNTHGYVPTGFKRLAEAIETKLKEKNA